MRWRQFVAWCEGRPASWWALLVKAMTACTCFNIVMWLIARAEGDVAFANYEFGMIIYGAICIALNEYNYCRAKRREES